MSGVGWAEINSQTLLSNYLVEILLAIFSLSAIGERFKISSNLLAISF